MKIVIKRCPVCTDIRNHSDEITTMLEYDLDMDVEVQDGDRGEFTILVDNLPLLQRGSDNLPSAEEVQAAVQNAVPTKA